MCKSLVSAASWMGGTSNPSSCYQTLFNMRHSSCDYSHQGPKVQGHLEPILAHPPPTMPPAWMKGPSFPAIKPPAMDKVTLNIFTTKVFNPNRPATHTASYITTAYYIYCMKKNMAGNLSLQQSRLCTKAPPTWVATGPFAEYSMALPTCCWYGQGASQCCLRKGTITDHFDHDVLKLLVRHGFEFGSDKLTASAQSGVPNSRHAQQG